MGKIHGKNPWENPCENDGKMMENWVMIEKNDGKNPWETYRTW
jgi:hypothetical protein